MRRELLYTPHLLLERIAQEALRRHRRRRLRGTPARWLLDGHIDTLELIEITQRQLAPRIIYDIGANRGTWTLLARVLCPQADVHAFEPLEFLHEEFRRNVADVDRVTLHGAALGAEPCEASMFVHAFADASSFLPLAPDEASRHRTHLKEMLVLSVNRLDDYLAEHRLPPPDLVKLDVQGYELEILKGAPSALAHARAVITEVSFQEIYAHQPLFGVVAHFLEDAGFHLHAFAHGIAAATPLGQADVLFIR